MVNDALRIARGLILGWACGLAVALLVGWLFLPPDDPLMGAAVSLTATALGAFAGTLNEIRLFEREDDLSSGHR